MWLIIREVLGWSLIVVGLYLVYLVVSFATEGGILEAFALALPATVVFRAGIGLLRLTSAIRIARDIRDT